MLYPTSPAIPATTQAIQRRRAIVQAMTRRVLAACDEADRLLATLQPETSH